MQNGLKKEKKVLVEPVGLQITKRNLVKPELGYILSNVVVICKRCNSQKGNASAGEHRRIADFIDKF